MRNLIKEPVHTLFLGTDWESVETLRLLLEDKRFNIVGVITTVDKPVGRKQLLTPSKVKDFALENNIPVFHTEKQQEKYHEALETFKPELIVCKAFGEIVPGFFLDYPKYKSINIHFSILPKYRGAVPIQKAILDGERETGITIMLMAEAFDEGDILKIFKEEILPTDTNLSLRQRLVEKSASVVGDILENWINGKIKPVKQDSSKATYCWQKEISKENAEINWNEMEPEYIERLVRAMIPWPVAWFTHNGKRIQIYEATLMNIKHNQKPGEVYTIEKNSTGMTTKDPNTVLKLHEIQIEGKTKTRQIFL